MLGPVRERSRVDVQVTHTCHIVTVRHSRFGALARPRSYVLASVTHLASRGFCHTTQLAAAVSSRLVSSSRYCLASLATASLLPRLDLLLCRHRTSVQAFLSGHRTSERRTDLGHQNSNAVRRAAERCADRIWVVEVGAVR